MRTIRIPNCDYQTYNAIMNEIMSKVPFAVLNSDYRKDLKLANISFWDSDYIPEQLSKYILKPPAESVFDFTGIELPPLDKEYEKRTTNMKYKDTKVVDKIQTCIFINNHKGQHKSALQTPGYLVQVDPCPYFNFIEDDKWIRRITPKKD